MAKTFSLVRYVRRSCVTAYYHFFLKRACETLSRYRLPSIFPGAGMRDALTLPLAINFPSSGHARCSHVTACLQFFLERACEMLSRYRLLSIFTQAGMRDALTLPLAINFSSSGHARRSHVTACLQFLLKRACETPSRYRSPSIFPGAGMQDDLLIPIPGIFSKFGL